MMKSASPPFSGYCALAGYILGRPLQDTSLDSVCQAGEVLTSCVTRDVQNAIQENGCNVTYVLESDTRVQVHSID